VREGGRVEELGAREEELAVELEHFVEFGGYVRSDDVFDADAGGFELPSLMGERLERSLWVDGRGLGGCRESYLK
jgi:hypothetical protein